MSLYNDCARKQGFSEMLRQIVMAGIRLAMAFLFALQKIHSLGVLAGTVLEIFFAGGAMGIAALNTDNLTIFLLMSQLCHTWVDRMYNGKIYYAMVCDF